MAFEDKYKALIESLYQRTITSSLPWESGTDNAVKCAIKEHTVTLYSSRSEDDEPLEVVVISDQWGGQRIDKFDDTDLGTAIPNSGNFANYYLMMSHLRRLASRVASGAEAALDEILNEISND